MQYYIPVHIFKYFYLYPHILVCTDVCMYGNVIRIFCYMLPYLLYSLHAYIRVQSTKRVVPGPYPRSSCILCAVMSSVAEVIVHRVLMIITVGKAQPYCANKSHPSMTHSKPVCYKKIVIFRRLRRLVVGIVVY